jgi:hypothetical protein
MLGAELFPISEYYRDNILDACTITRGGKWWTAMLLINDPKKKAPMISLYKWNKVGENWKIRKSYHIHTQKEVDEIIKELTSFKKYLIK